MSRMSRMILDMFQFALEARIDLKNQGENADLKIDPLVEQIKIIAPKWFSKGGIGYVIQSNFFNIVLDITCVKDGILGIWLRANDISDEKFGRIPVWIDYCEFLVNGKSVLDEVTPAYHDKPYCYKKTVKNGQKIRLEIKWEPHRNWLQVESAIEQLCDSYIRRFYVERSKLCGLENQILDDEDAKIRNKVTDLQSKCNST